jgi:hypothetical protein
MTRALLSRWLLVGCGVAAGAAITVGSPEAPTRQSSRKYYDPICQVWLDPHDKFTRVVPEPQPQAHLTGSLATITVNYTGFTPQAQTAFQHAVNIWQNLLTSAVPTVVNANFADLGNPLLLGSAGPVTVWRDFAGTPRAATWFAAAIANKIAGVDLGGAGSVEISANFNSTASWYYGTDGLPPGGQIDFVSVVLHELGHGLGFIGSGTVSAGAGSIGLAGFPLMYDALTVDGAGNSLINTSIYPNGSAALGAALTSNNVFWNGAAGVAANGGARPKLYAPASFASGSSFSHLDEATYPAGNVHSLMTPFIGSAEAIHTPGGITLGIFTDQGWTASSPCTYTLGATSAAAPQGGVVGATVNVNTQTGCPWTAVSNSPGFITVAGGTPGTGSGTVTYNVSANLSTFRAGTMTIAGHVFTVTQNGLGPTMNLDKTSLRFGATSTGVSFVAQTSAQIVRLTQTGTPGAVTWTATSTQPWLQVSPASGSGSANLSITVVATGGIPASGTSLGQINLVFTGAANQPGPIAVTLTTILNGASAVPLGTVDTPLDNQTNVSGAVPFTGWVLDDTEVAFVSVCRAPFGAEVAPVDPNCGGFAQIFVGFGVFIDGARPDVAAAFPNFPRSTRGGWGFMVLTNMLPNQGNGTYVFQMWARDREGNAVVLGTRMMTCNNAAATLPFGAIDTPTQGGDASGAAFVNFGWVLAGQPLASGRQIPINGSTISVIVDGVSIGTVDYNHVRPDIEGLFPGYFNTTGGRGAIGFRVLNTTGMTNGTHTIAWLAVDNMGAAQGIGSRFFTVTNGAGSLTAAQRSSGEHIGWRSAPMAVERVDALMLDPAALSVRTGWSLDSGYRAVDVDDRGRAVVHSEEVSRVEVAFGAPDGERYDGYSRVAGELAPLPIGSNLDQATGAFTWAPGVGFVGAYDLVFVRSVGGTAVARHEVRVVLHPKGSRARGQQVVIDTPAFQQDVAQPFALAGWAADLDAPRGTGITTLHAWAYPLAGGPPVFLGAASYGGARPDVAGAHGDQFKDSGFGLTVRDLMPGNYDLAIFPWSRSRADFLPATVVRVTVR